MPIIAVQDLPELPMAPEPGETGYDLLRRLRETSPFVRLAMMGFPMGLRHRHLGALVNDAVSRQIETEAKLAQGIFSGPIFEFSRDAMLFANGDVHRRRRAPIQRTFAFKLMDAMRPRAAEITREIVSRHVGAGPVDFVGEVAAQLPARLIADILGIPRSDLPVFMRWIEDTAASIGFFEADKRAQIEQSLAEFSSYVDDLLEQRRKEPRQDFLSEYVAATTQAGDLTESEIRTQVLGLILAGSDTTRGSLCMTLARLLTHPEQWADFCADPDGLKAGVVNEGLRYDPIVAALARVMTTDLVVDDVQLLNGQVVTVSLMSALRDPEVYADPDRFDIRRTDHPRWHPVFGAGPHRCAGEALAKAEMEEALAVIARLAPKTRLEGPTPTLAPGAIRQVGPMLVSFAA